MAITKQQAQAYYMKWVDVTYWTNGPGSGPSAPVVTKGHRLDYVDNVQIGLDSTVATTQLGNDPYWKMNINLSDIVSITNASGTATTTATQASILGMPLWGWLLAATAVVLGIAAWRKQTA